MDISFSSAVKGFATTRWTLVVAAKDRTAPEAQVALAAPCSAYWYPLYVFIRRQDHTADEAQDLTQAFFARLLEKDFLKMVERTKGRFRSFLLAACKHFLANERDRARAQKRGGGRQPISIDFQSAEVRYACEPSHSLTAERLFERRWAIALLNLVLGRLQEEMEQDRKGNVYECLKVYLTAGKTNVPYAQVAANLQMSEAAVKVAVHRLRRRYRELLREEIGRTVHQPAEIEAEIRDLFTALGP